MRPRHLIALATTSLVIAAPAACIASGSVAPRIDGAEAEFNVAQAPKGEPPAAGYAIGGIVRYAHKLGGIHPGIIVDQRLTVGEHFTRLSGGTKGGHVGRKAKHCYLYEYSRPYPLHTPKVGAHWMIGLYLKGKVVAVKHVTLTRSPAGGTITAAEHRLGC